MYRFLFVLIATLSWTLSASAQPSMQLPDEVGLIDHPRTLVVDLDTGDLLIEAYSFDVCHDGEVVSIDEDNVVQGQAIEELEFDTHIVTTVDGGWAIAAVLADGNTVGEDASEGLEFYRATYDLDAIGVTDLTFCGELEVTNAVVDGEDVVFELAEGSIDVREEGASFRRGDIDGDGVVHPLLDGFRMLMWGSGEADPPPCMEAADVDNNGLISAIPDGLRVLNWGYAADAPPEPGPNECGPDPEGGDRCEDADTCEGNGPTFVDPDEVAFTLSASRASGDVDDVVTLTISLVGSGDPVGYQIGVCHGDGVTIEEDDVTFEDPDPPIIFKRVNMFDEGWTGIVLVALREHLEVEEELDLYQADYTVVSDEPTVIEFCDTLGEEYVVATEIMLSDDGNGVLAVPEMVSGGVNLPAPAGSFLRGDANGDGEVSAIPDGLFILRWGFTDGEAPSCDDAADVDDDGELSVFADVFALFRWEFQDGAAPPDPGPDSCGLELESDDLGCETSPVTCQ